MSFRKILVAGLFLISSAVFAQENIPCPAIYTVQDASSKIDSAVKVGFTSYKVYSSAVAFRDAGIPWYVSVNNVDAISKNEALMSGRASIRNTSIKKSEDATKKGHYYYCYYGNSDIIVSSGYMT